MDEDLMCFTDEFRMRSPVVWFCFAIVVLCALSAESMRSYPIAHGEAGPIIGTIVPAIGYTNVGVGPPFIGRRQQRQNPFDPNQNPNQNPDYYDELNEFIDEDDDEYEDYSGGIGGGFGGGFGGGGGDYGDEDEEDDEEGDSDTDNEEFGINNAAVDNVQIQGRQAYINNHYIDEPYVQRQRPQYKRVKSSTRKRTKTKSTKKSSNKKKSSQGQKKKATSPLADLKPQSANLPNKKKEPEVTTAMPENVVTMSPLSVLQSLGDKQTIQLRPVATSTQFIATPVADLILRLSISLAKPIGQGNGTSFNVPIRIHQSAVKNVEDSKIIRADLELSQTDNMSVVTVPSADKDSIGDDADVDEADEKEQTAEIPVTELSRK